METTDDITQDEQGSEDATTLDGLVRSATRLVMGSAGIAVASASRWQAAAGGGSGAPAAVGSLASAALGLGLATERLVVRSASAVGETAASVTWGVMRATPFRGPLERLAERFRSEQRLSEHEVHEAVTAIADAIADAVLSRIDVDRVLDRLAVERVLARIDRGEIERRIRGRDVPVGG